MGGENKKSGGGCLGCFGSLIVICIIIYLIKSVGSFIVNNFSIMMAIVFILFIIILYVEIKKKNPNIDFIYLINKILFPPAKVVFIFWTAFWSIGSSSYLKDLWFILLGYIFLCGIADLIYKANKKFYNKYQEKIIQKKNERLERIKDKNKPEDIRKDSKDYMTTEEWERSISEIQQGLDKVHNDIVNIEDELENQQNAPIILNHIKSLADIVNITNDPKEFFECYEKMQKQVDRLISIPNITYITQPPKELKIELQNQKQPAIRKMIDRYENYIRRKNVSYEIFYNTLRGYFSIMDFKNQSYVREIYDKGNQLYKYTGNASKERKKENHFNVEQFAKECNEYLRKQDMEELYGVSEMNQQIDFDNMVGHQFENFCADILKKNGFTNVEVTQGSGDHGIDILAEKDNITYAIQCKCYSSNIGNAAVQQAHTGKSLYHKDIAVVLTNRYFTSQAKEEAGQLGVKLWDRDKLNEMIEKQD